MINASVSRNAGENSLGVLRRFTRKVQGSGIIPRVRSLRFSSRVQSHYKIKQKTLKSLNRKKEVETLIKLGKIAPKTEHKK